MSRKAKQQTIYNFLQDKRETIRKPEDIKSVVLNKLREEFDPKRPSAFKTRKPSTAPFKHDLSWNPESEPINHSIDLKNRQPIFSLYKTNEEPVQARVFRMENRLLDDLKRRSKKMMGH